MTTKYSSSHLKDFYRGIMSDKAVEKTVKIQENL